MRGCYHGGVIRLHAIQLGVMVLLVSVLIGVFYAPFTVSAQGLVSCGQNVYTVNEGDQICTYGECTTCDILKTAQLIINFFVLVCVLVATVLFVNAGVLYLGASANPGNVSRAHKIFFNTVIGLIIILSAWLVIGVIMTTLANDTGQFIGPWDTILCNNEQEARCVPVMEGVGINPGGEPGVGGQPGSGTGGGPSDARDSDLRPSLKILGVEVNKEYPATSLDGLQPTTLTGVLDVQKSCGGAANCDIVITGGTEGGVHAAGEMSHGNGYKLDLRTTDSLNQAIESESNGWRQIDPRGGPNGGPQYTRTDPSTKVTSTCVKETTVSHWDCTFTK